MSILSNLRFKIWTSEICRCTSKNSGALVLQTSGQNPSMSTPVHPTVNDISATVNDMNASKVIG